MPDNVRKEIPGPEVTGVNKKFARWYVRNISKHIHPDKFNDFNTKHLMQELLTINNRIVNKLKGHA